MFATMAKKKDRHKNPKVGVHLPPDLRLALHDYIKGTEPEPTITAVVRLAIRRFLDESGYLPGSKGGEEK